MESPAEFKHIIRFAEFELDVRAGELLTNGHRVILPEKPFQILAALLEHPGEMVTRDDLVKRLWPAGTFVDFNLGLNKAVNRLREALDDSAEQPRFIQTIPKRGYRFVAAVAVNGPAETAKPPSVVVDSLNVPAGDPQFEASGGAVVTGQHGRLRTAAIFGGVLAIALGASYAEHVTRTTSRKLDIERIQVSRLTDSGKVDKVAISPDGRYVCYSKRDRGGSGLWLRQLATGSDTQILPADAISFEGLSFSPDGNYIYYVRADKDDPGFKYLYTMPVLGGPSRLLVKDIDSPVNFSPDGRQFVYTRGMPTPNATELRIANADGSDNRLLATMPSTFPGFQPGPTWSPNGRTIALSLMGYGKQSFMLDTVSVSDGSVRELLTRPKSIGRPLWLPEGNALLVVMNDRNDRGQFWTISYPRTETRRITNDLTNYREQADLTRSAKSLVVVADQTVANVWVAPAGHLDDAKQITSISMPLLEVNESPDGRLLTVGQDGRLWGVQVDGSQRVPFTDVENASVPTPCGRYVVFMASQMTSTDLLRVDSDGTNRTKLASGDLANWTVVCSPDDKYVFYADWSQPHTIMRIPVEGGTAVKIAQILGEFMVGRMSISPDAKFLAYPYEEYTPAPVIKLAITPATGGKAARIITAPGGTYRYGKLVWSLDDKNLQYVLTQNGASNIWEQPLDGGKPRQITKFPAGQIFDFHWSHDGKRLLMSRGEVSSDVVLLNNLR